MKDTPQQQQKDRIIETPQQQNDRIIVDILCRDYHEIYEQIKIYINVHHLKY